MALNVRVTGDGFPVVLIHGFCEDHTLWDQIAGNLAPHYTVITPDLPGFGLSQAFPDPFSLDDVAMSVLDAIQPYTKGPFALAGHSLGGYVSLSIAQNFYDEVAGLCLFHSTSFADTGEKKLNRDRSIEFIAEHGTSAFIRSFFPGLFHEANVERLRSKIEELKAIGLQVEAEVIIDYTRAMKDRPDRSRILYQFDKPVLLIAGDHDPAVPFKDSMAQLQRLDPDSGVILENTGHMGMYERPEEATAALHRFLKKVFS